MFCHLLSREIPLPASIENGLSFLFEDAHGDQLGDLKKILANPSQSNKNNIGRFKKQPLLQGGNGLDAL